MSFGRKFPKITIDYTKCTVPFLCKQCLQVCPTAIFWVERIMKYEERLKELDPRVDGIYKLEARRRDQCVVCKRCVEVCPAGAITIEIETPQGKEVFKKEVKTKDPLKELKEAPYPLFVAPKPYSFDLNVDMINLISDEFNLEGVASQFAEAANGQEMDRVEEIGKKLFEDFGERWMSRTMQLGEEYSDRTIEMVKETVDHNGNQFLLWPHVPQRFIEIAYLSTQQFRTLPVIINNQFELSYQVPQCLLFQQIKEKCGEKVANLMTCRNACLKALETLRNESELDLVINMEASTAKDGYCGFSMKKI